MGANQPDRMRYIDAMKGIAIIMVLLLHSLMNNAEKIESEYARAMNMLSYMALPCFFFINGYLYNHKYSLSPLSAIRKKFKAYYIPFVGFSLFFWLFHNVFVKLHLVSEELYSFKDYAKRFVMVLLMHMESRLNGAMWFLRALLIMVCIYILLEYVLIKLLRIEDRNKRYLVLLAIIVTMAITGKVVPIPNYMNSRRIFRDFYMFFLGVLVKEYEVDKFIDKHKLPVFLVCGSAITATGFSFFGGIAKETYGLDIPGIICGIIAVFALSKMPLIENSKFLAFCGKASLDIMCLHFLAYKVVSFIIIKKDNLDIDRLTEIPVLLDTHGITFLFYVITGLALCLIEFILRTRILNYIREKRSK